VGKLGKARCLDEQLCFALYSATNAMTRLYRPILADFGLTYPQYLVLLVLWQDGPRPIGKIAERLRLGPSAIVPLVDQLQRSSLVRRRKDSLDRRMVHIELTQAGRGLEPAVTEACEAVVGRSGLDTAAVEALRLQVEALIDRLAGAATAEAL